MPKYVKFVLIPLAALLVVTAVVCCGFYLYANEVRFDYIITSQPAFGVDDPIYASGLYANGFEVSFPFFGNSTSLNQLSGTSYAFPLGIGEENMEVYMAVNTPIMAYAAELTRAYKGMLDINCKVDISDAKDILTVTFSGRVFPDGIDNEPQPFEETTLTFNIKDASLDNLPTLIEA